MYKAIIFDFFGVFCPDITLEWFKKSVSEYKSKLPEFQAICARSDYGKLSKADFYTEVAQLTGIPTGKITNGVEAEVDINTNLVTLAQRLKDEGYIIACLSNGTHEWTLDVISRHVPAKLFDEIVLSGDLGIVKPDPRIYLYVLQKLGVDASQAVFVDDKETNVDAAEKCGITGILFTDTAKCITEFEHIVLQR